MTVTVDRPTVAVVVLGVDTADRADAVASLVAALGQQLDTEAISLELVTVREPGS